jgi:hypothetical protein
VRSSKRVVHSSVHVIMYYFSVWTHFRSHIEGLTKGVRFRRVSEREPQKSCHVMSVRSQLSFCRTSAHRRPSTKVKTVKQFIEEENSALVWLRHKMSNQLDAQVNTVSAETLKQAVKQLPSKQKVRLCKVHVVGLVDLWIINESIDLAPSWRLCIWRFWWTLYGNQWIL